MSKMDRIKNLTPLLLTQLLMTRNFPFGPKTVSSLLRPFKWNLSFSREWFSQVIRDFQRKSSKMDFNCKNFEKQNTGSSLEQFCALLVIYEIFRNSGNSKWNFSGNGHVLSNLAIWDIFPTQFQSQSSILHSKYVNSGSFGIPVKFRNL